MGKQSFKKGAVLHALLIAVLAVIAGAALVLYYSAPDLEEARIQLPPAEGKITPSDYSNARNWLALPEKTEKEADVFYVYPTVWQARDGEAPLSSIDSDLMRSGAAQAFEAQATAFEAAGDIYAPYYRQLDAAFTLALPEEEREKYIKGAPKTDVLAAFDYYIKNYNNGRPYILAGHSQGAMLLKEILFDYLKNNPAARENLVAAYVIGYGVTRNELMTNRHLRFASGPDDTGVIISYNTEAPKMTVPNPTVLEGSVAINPVSWTTEEILAPAIRNKGSLLERGGKPVRVNGLADAAVNKARGTVVCSTVNADKYSMPAPVSEVFPKGVYHKYDIPFYYYNLRENAENRVKKFLESKK